MKKVKLMDYRISHTVADSPSKAQASDVLASSETEPDVSVSSDAELDTLTAKQINAEVSRET